MVGYYNLFSQGGFLHHSGYNHLSMDVITLNGAQAQPYFDRMVDIYQAAFAVPPFNETLADALSFAARLPHHARHVDFRCTVARPAPGEEIVGFAYGYSGMPRTWWYELVVEYLPEDNAQFWLGDYFEFAELAVHPSWQGQGIGGALLDALTENLPYRTAALSTPALETSAWHLYTRHGWVSIIEDFEFPGVEMPYRIMVKELHRRNDSVPPYHIII